jgi:ArsR family transcriptional regulator, arsenate/arsenite/antimonite-responsive transcriptional repressor
MTYAKINAFDSDLQDVAKIAKALSHPARLAIIKHLSECDTCISGDIANEMPLSRTTVSQHLQELKNLGLIDGEIDGVRICYCLNQKKIIEARDKIQAFFKLGFPGCNC